MDTSSVKRGVEGLQSAAGFIQSSIAKKLSIYKFPKLTFIADESLRDGFEMVQKLNALEAEEKALQSKKDTEVSDEKKAE